MNIPRPDQGLLRSEINVTPLVDVCLVLLILFMVVTPLLGGGVMLPQTDHPQAMPPSGRQVQISLTPDGRVFDREGAIPPAQLQAALRGYHDRSPDASVRVAADARIPYGRVRGLLASVNRAGFGRVSLLTQKRIASTP